MSKGGGTMRFAKVAKACVAKALVKKSEQSAVKSANSACYSWQYQPKTSEAIKKLRKF